MDPEPINTDVIAKHPCEGELFGEKVLFFVALMPGGKGGFDLYYAPKKTDGVFGLPVNLGAVVNTAGEEASPFYRDGKLYFSSNGRPSMGGLDVYESQWNGSVWSEPKPLPLGINSPPQARRPSAPGGLVNCASRARTAAAASSSGPGNSRSNLRTSSKGNPVWLSVIMASRL